MFKKPQLHSFVDLKWGHIIPQFRQNNGKKACVRFVLRGIISIFAETF